LGFGFFPILLLSFFVISLVPVCIGALLSVPAMFIAIYLRRQKYLQILILFELELIEAQPFPLDKDVFFIFFLLINLLSLLGCPEKFSLYLSSHNCGNV
jgi:hypothetical protein